MEEGRWVINRCWYSLSLSFKNVNPFPAGLLGRGKYGREGRSLRVANEY
jgi:hypothetical protein